MPWATDLVTEQSLCGFVLLITPLRLLCNHRSSYYALRIYHYLHLPFYATLLVLAFPTDVFPAGIQASGKPSCGISITDIGHLWRICHRRITSNILPERRFCLVSA